MAPPTAGMPSCVAKQVTRPVRPGIEKKRRSDRAVPSVTGMDITIHSSFLPHTDRTHPSPSTATPWASRSVSTSGTAGCGGSPSALPASPTRNIVLHPPTATPGLTDDEKRTLVELMAKGSYFGVNLATKDLDGTFATLVAGDAEVVQEPTEQPYRRPRLRLPRPRGQHDPHPGGALTSVGTHVPPLIR